MSNQYSTQNSPLDQLKAPHGLYTLTQDPKDILNETTVFDARRLTSPKVKFNFESKPLTKINNHDIDSSRNLSS